jgi:hypothetical protein
MCHSVLMSGTHTIRLRLVALPSAKVRKPSVALAGKESTVVAGELGVVLRRALSCPLRGKNGVAPRRRPPPDHQGGPF